MRPNDQFGTLITSNYPFKWPLNYLFHDPLADVKDALPVQSEAILSVTSVDQVLDVAADVLGELLEKGFGLLVS